MVSRHSLNAIVDQLISFITNDLCVEYREPFLGVHCAASLNEEASYRGSTQDQCSSRAIMFGHRTLAGSLDYKLSAQTQKGTSSAESLSL